MRPRAPLLPTVMCRATSKRFSVGASGPTCRGRARFGAAGGRHLLAATAPSYPLKEPPPAGSESTRSSEFEGQRPVGGGVRDLSQNFGLHLMKKFSSAFLRLGAQRERLMPWRILDPASGIPFPSHSAAAYRRRMPSCLFKDDRHAWDSFDRESALGTLLSTLEKLPPPACVALYGAWGVGKTTFLHRAHDRWEEGKQGVAVWFDPWEHEHRGDVVSPLLHAIVQRIRRDDRAKGVRWKELSLRIAKTLLSLGVRVGAAVAFPGNSKLAKLSDIKLEDLTREFQEWSSFHDDIARLRDQFNELVEGALEGLEPSARLVVFLDDLDRCLPDSVVTLIEAVKLLFFGDGRTDTRAIFVFALDRHIVGEAIANRYPRSSLYTGESYLEKIFDVSLEVPTTSVDQLTRYVKRLLPDADSFLDGLGGVEVLASVLALPVFDNPRVIKRTLNRLFLLLEALSHRPAVSGAAAAHDHQVRTNFVELFDPRSYPSAPPGWDNRHRLLAWIAGAERFRAFRLAFFDAAESELKALHSTLRGVPKPMNDALTRLAVMPGMSSYYETIFPRAWGDTDVLRERSPAKLADSATIRDFDAQLRRFGL